MTTSEKLIVLMKIDALPLQINFTLLQMNRRRKKGKRVPQSQTAALPRPKKEEETDKSKQAQTEQTHEKHQD